MDISGTIGSLPKKMEDITTNISKGAETLDKMVDKLDNAIKNVETHNPVSGAIVDGLSKVTGALNTGTDKLKNAADFVSTKGQEISKSTQGWCGTTQETKKALQDLKNCQDVVTTSSLLVNAIVDSCSGHFHPRANEQVLTKFDGQWDSWAKTINGIFQNVSPSGQTNILESLAKEKFGDNIFYLGSAIKNESAGIFGGIADFEDAIHAFGGSYRNPIEAAKKIETGVKGIINATERVANSINNMIKTYQKGMGYDVTGNPILSYIGNLHDNKAVAAVNKVLTAAGGVSTLWTDGTAFGQAVKSKDPVVIYNTGKKTIDDAKVIFNSLKDTNESVKITTRVQETTKITDTSVGGIEGTDGIGDSGGIDGTNTDGIEKNVDDGSVDRQQDDTKQKENDDDESGKTDSYVCSGATMRCTFGDRKSKLTVYPDRTVFLTGQPMANITDHTSLYNIAPFGKCHTTKYPATGAATAAAHGKLTPMPCVPGTVSNWINGKNDYIIKGDPALLKSSYCRCCYGGVITITDDGQKDTGKADLSRDMLLPLEELNRSAEEKSKLDADAVLDGIQNALDIAGFVPAAGAIPDLLNAAIYAARGDMANAGLSVLAAVPGIGDAAAAVKIAGKGVKAAKKAGKVAGAASDNVVSLSKYKATKAQDVIDKSDNIARFPSDKVSKANLSKAKGVEKQENVIKMNQYEKRVEKQVNGPDKVTITKKLDTIVDMDNYRVNKVQPTTKNGSSTDYQQSNSYRGLQSGNYKQYGPYKKQNLEYKKKNVGLSQDEEVILQKLIEQEKNRSIFN